MSLEELVKAWLDDLATAATAAGSGDPLFGVDMQASPYESITKTDTVQVGPCHADQRPNADASDVEEFNGMLTLMIVSQVANPADQRTYGTARNRVVQLGQVLAKKVLANNTLADSLSIPRVR